MPTYVRPQVLVHQEFTLAPQNVVQNQNAFVFGPHYQLFRFAEAAEKALIGLGAYDRLANTPYAWPNQPAGSAVDLDYVKLFVDELLLKYLTVPNSPVNPVYAVSTEALNKLRATPRVDASVRGGTGTVTMATAGYFTGLVSLPEAYYLWPQSTFNLGTVAGVFNYETTEGLTGSIVIPANATTAGVIVQGPHGITLDFGAAAFVKAPRTVKITDAAGTSYFNVTLKASRRQQHIDDGCAALPIKVNINIAAAVPLAVTWNGGTKTLTIDADDVATTLAALRTAISVAVGFSTEFDIDAAVTGTGANMADKAVDQDAVDLNTNADIELMPDTWRSYIYENAYVFKTANGFFRYSSLLRDVKVGDKVRWKVTPVSTGVEVSGMANVVGLEADYTLPIVGASTPGAANLTTVAGLDLSAGVGPVGYFTPGVDNQRDMPGPNTKIFSLAAANNYMIGDPSGSIFTDTLRITITTGGLKGVARATVEAVSGGYRRTNVLIENLGARAGKLYLGKNVYIEFDATGDPDAVFQAGDTYDAGPLTAPFTAVTNPASGGTYRGARDTSYRIAVRRGGVFTPAKLVIDGLSQPVVAVTLNTDIGEWRSPVDDEMVLECTTGGLIGAARFRLTSQRGEDVSSIAFGVLGSAGEQQPGSSGVKLYFTSAGTPTFVAGNYWVVAVKAATPQLQINDSAGIDQASTVVVAAGDTVSVGLNGVTLVVPANGNTLGGFATDGCLGYNDRFSIDATASQPAQVQTLVLDSNVPVDVLPGQDAAGDANNVPDRFQLELFMVRSGVEIPAEQHDPAMAPGTFNWVAALANLTVNAGITLTDDEWVDGLGDHPYLPVESALLYSQYRALLTNYVGAIGEMVDPAEVIPALGPIDPDNPLAYLAYAALLNSASVVVRYSAVPSNDLAGYLAVLALIEKPDTVYGLVPAARDEAINAAIKAHVEAMSNEFNKRWRICFISEPTPSEIAKVNSTTHPLGNDWQATIVDDPANPGQITKVIFTEDCGLIANARVGDELRYGYATDAWGNQAYLTGVIASIASNTVCYLVTSIGAPIALAARTEVWHSLSVTEQAAQVKAQAEAYASRRVYYLFPDTIQAGGLTYDAQYAAAVVAGLRSASVPQQGLTNVELIGIDNIPATYNLFTPTQLDTIASGGVLIVTQDIRAGQVYVRHQLSTDFQSGDLRLYEMSMTTNIDSCSYYFAALLRPYIGRFNVTPDLIEVLRTQMEAGINYLGSFTSVGLLGPQLLLDQTKLISVAQHPTLRDRVIIRVRVGLPPPLNNIDLYLVA